MTAISGAKFWSGFAAGALSSIASSAWRGGMSSETVGNVTTETMHHGISDALHMSNGFGTIAFGTVSGGAGAVLTKGNFWQGAVSGLFVSALNHVAHGSENSKNLLYSRRYAKDENGNIISESLNYFSPKDDANLYNRAESEPLRMNELTIYSHGSPAGFANSNNMNIRGDLIRILYEDSTMWKNFVDGKTKSLTMVLKACTTGSLKGQNIYHST